MKKKEEKAFIIAGIFAILFLLFIILIKTVDVRPIGPEGTEVGLAAVNSAFHEMTGLNMMFYKLSKVLGLFELATAAFWAGYGIFILVRKRSVMRVPSAILAAGVLYAAVAVLYVFFEIVVINYRPVIMTGDEHVEASFPSTHTMLGIIIMGSTFFIIRRLVRNKMLKGILQTVCILALIGTVIGRMLCGVHWLTDIIGGILISTSLMMAYLGLCGVFQRIKAKRGKRKSR